MNIQKMIEQVIKSTKTYKDLKHEHLMLRTNYLQLDNALAMSYRDIDILKNTITEFKVTNKELEKFKKEMTTRKTKHLGFWTVNGKSIRLSSWLKDHKELENLYYWMEDNNYLIEADNFKDVVLKSIEQMNKFLKPIENYRRDGAVDKWDTPMEFIKRGFMGDCDDHATFMNYFIRAQLYHNDLYDKHKEDILFCIGATSTLDGWALENHAYNVVFWDGWYYVLESTAYYKERNKELFKVAFPFNKYPVPVFMANEVNVYRDVTLLKGK